MNKYEEGQTNNRRLPTALRTSTDSKSSHQKNSSQDSADFRKKTKRSINFRNFQIENAKASKTSAEGSVGNSYEINMRNNPQEARTKVAHTRVTISLQHQRKTNPPGHPNSSGALQVSLVGCYSVCTCMRSFADVRKTSSKLNQF